MVVIIFAKGVPFPYRSTVTLEAMALFSNEGSKSVKLLYGKVRKTRPDWWIKLWDGDGGLIAGFFCFELPASSPLLEKAKTLLCKGQNIWKDDEMIFFSVRLHEASHALATELTMPVAQTRPIPIQAQTEFSCVFARRLF